VGRGGRVRRGFCLDTCHAHAGGEELLGIVDRVKAITGRIDLVHANDSRDTFDSGADRHDNSARATSSPSSSSRCCGRPGAGGGRDAGAGHEADINLLRAGIAR
jgi:deoxyribonuclease-4